LKIESWTTYERSFPRKTPVRIRVVAHRGVLQSGGMVLFLIGCIVFSTACGGRDPQEKEYQAFIRIHDGERQIEEFKKKSYCAQIDLYLYATRLYPPAHGMAMYIAHSGEAILPTLLNRLRTEKEERIQSDLIYALRVMAVLHPDLKNNKEVLEVVRQKIEEMHGSYLSESEESLKRILAEPRR